jgi:hypothetical protein
MFHFAFCHRCVETGMLPISLAERIPRVCDPRNSGNDFLERSANFSGMCHTDSIIPAKSAGRAGNGNRTRMASLEGWNFTIKLCPREK